MKKIMLFLLMSMILISLAGAFDWDDGIMAYYSFDETTGTNLPELAWGLNNGTLENMENSDWVPSKLGYGLSFDAVNELVNVTDVMDGLSNFSMCSWLNTSSVASVNLIAGVMGATPSWSFELKSSVRFDFFGGGGNVFKTGDTGGLNTGDWQFVCAVYNGTRGVLYVNGGYDGMTGPTSGASNNITYNLLIGGYNSPPLRFFSGTIDELGFWNRSLSSSEITELWNSGNGLAYETETSTTTTITLLSPTDDTTTSLVGINFSANYTTGVMYNFTNATYFLWNDTGVFNNSLTITITGTSNNTNYYIDEFGLGVYDWNVKACWQNASYLNCSFASNNYTLNVGANITAQNYTNQTYETAKATFSINLTLINGSSLYAAQLYFNGTLYSATIQSLGSNKYFIYKVLDIPLLNNQTKSYEPKNVFWRLTYPLGAGVFKYQNTSGYLINVSKLNLSIAGGDNTIRVANFTAYDEEDLSRINPYDFYGTFEYWLGGGSVRKNVSLSRANVAEVNLAINNSNLTYYSDAIIQYEKTSYIKRSYYFVNATLSNITQDVNLYFLNTTKSTSFIIELKDYVLMPITSAYIYIQRYYPADGTFKTVEMAKTDKVGSTVGHFEVETEDYRLIAFKDGQILYESGVQKIYCGEAPCTLILQVEAGAGTTWRPFGNLSNLLWTLEYDNSTKTFTYTYVDTSGTTQYGRLYVYSENPQTGKSTICNTTSTSSAATLICNVSSYTGTIYATAYISRSPEILIWMISILKEALKDIFSLEGLFLAMIILLVLGLAGIWNPVVGIILIVAGMIVVNLIGIASFGIITIWGVIIIGAILIWQLKT